MTHTRFAGFALVAGLAVTAACSTEAKPSTSTMDKPATELPCSFEEYQDNPSCMDGEETPATTTTTAPSENPEITNARRSAESYLEFTGFSRTGLIKQLEFEGYSTDSATKAVDSLDVDWNTEAVESAESYLEFSGFSHSGLVEQLAFEGFTPDQAEHGATVALGA